MTRILVTNDDGVYSEGLRLLAKALAPLGEVTVVAPDREQSATGHSLTLHRPLRMQKLEPNWYAVDGTPTDCVNLRGSMAAARNEARSGRSRGSTSASTSATT